MLVFESPGSCAASYDFFQVLATALSLLTLNACVLMPTSLADAKDIILGVQCK